MVLAIFITVYILCGVLAYGLTLGYFQRKYTDVYVDIAYLVHRDIVNTARIMALSGPFGLIVAWLCSERGKYGLKFR
jgi:hypothetical protein